MYILNEILLIRNAYHEVSPLLLKSPPWLYYLLVHFSLPENWQVFFFTRVILKPLTGNKIILRRFPEFN